MTESQSTPTRIAMWSTPRSLSTALMRSWESRPDTIVIDEPLHGAFIKLGNWQYGGVQTIYSLKFILKAALNVPSKKENRHFRSSQRKHSKKTAYNNVIF